jgi:ATP phosphoribosyltransferase regulatory subunit
MNIVNRWLLPDGVDEVLPPTAATLEKVRRQLLDTFESWGYELVIPPMVEFLESLLTGTGTDLDLKTFKITDQVSGRMMGITADITPQVARIDAHSLNNPGNVRLCYAGTVLHAKADNMLASRTPISVGAELFGDTGPDGDLEIVSLMLASVGAVGDQAGRSLHLELGDVGIYRDLIETAAISDADERQIFDMIQNKALPDLDEKVKTLNLADPLAELIAQLPRLCGDLTVLEKGKILFKEYPGIVQRLDNLSQISQSIASRHADVDIYFDLSELRGYNYHTGSVFAAYLTGTGTRIAKGGRYDDVGDVFGRARGATGFDIDIKTLVKHLGEQAIIGSVGSGRVSVAYGLGSAERRWQKICELRQQGYVVIEGQAEQCEFTLIETDNEWSLRSND